MQYTKGIGVIATKEELDAVLTFTDIDSKNGVALRVDKGELLVWSSEGENSIYHRGDAFDGEGKPCVDKHSWQVQSDSLAAIKRMMQSGQEVVLGVSPKGKMTRFTVRDIASPATIMDGSLDGRVSEQILLNLPGLIPIDPPESFRGTNNIAWYPGVLKRLDLVGKATGKGSITQFWLPDTEYGRTYVKIDTRKTFVDGDAPRWTVIIAAKSLDKELTRNEKVTIESLRLPGIDNDNGTVSEAVRNLKSTLKKHGATIEITESGARARTKKTSTDPIHLPGIEGMEL